MKKIILAVFSLVIIFYFFDKLYPIDISKYKEASTIVLDKNNEILCGLLTHDEKWRFPIKSHEVDPLYIKMLLEYEDRRFWYHLGVDPIALIRSIWQLIKNGEVVSGASTLTMQVIRLLKPRPRTVTTKIIEIFKAIQLELHYDKKTILSMYLTLAPYGGNLEGIRSASLSYFAKEPKKLTISEAALLVILPQSPSLLRPDRNNIKAKNARNKVIKRIRKAKIISEINSLEAQRKNIQKIRNPFPKHAWHLAQHLISKYPNKKTHHTYIDKYLQMNIEELISNELPFLNKKVSIAVIVINNKNSSIISYLGSPNIYSESKHGYVDMVRAIRSPGSTLKPAIYALGFDKLLIHPDTIINDDYTVFNGNYTPSNFNNIFCGQVAIREALQKSLNIPAVKVLEKVGASQFVNSLSLAGIPLKLANDNPGLPIALGGCGVSLLNLVTLYTSFANNGIVASLKTCFSCDEKKVQIFSPSSVWYITQILKAAPSPEHFTEERFTKRKSIAFKTGTSYGYRDALAIGYTKNYTVGVWIGRPDGGSNPGKIGRKISAPILFKIFDILPVSFEIIKKEIPKGIILTNNLPSKLKYFDKKRNSDKFEIAFPKNDSIIEIDDNKFSPILLSATGGKKPLNWLINGKPIDSNVWYPNSYGFTSITVIDAKGKSASCHIKIQPITW